MKKPTHLILDNFSHPGISFFWKRHGLSIMEQLVPNEFLFTTSDMPLEKIIEREIWSGWKKIILIGTPNSIRRGFNIIMQSSRECRNSISFGFWPITFRKLTNYIFKSSLNLRPYLQVFKTGHTIQVDVPKIQFITAKKETRYFWNVFFVSSIQNSAKSTIFVDDQNFEIRGKFKSRIVFQDEILNSLTIHPSKLSRVPFLKVYIKKKNIPVIQKLYKINKLIFNNGIVTGSDFLIKTGRNIEFNGNWANLSMELPEVKDTVDSINFVIEKKALCMIIPTKPIPTNEKIRKIIPAIRPTSAIANNLET